MMKKNGKLFAATMMAAVLFSGCGTSAGNVTNSTTGTTTSAVATETVDQNATTESSAVADGELKHLVIAEPLHSIGYLPLYVAQQEGYFAEEGLDVEVIQATGGSHVTAVISGDAWGVIGGVDSNAIANSSGNCPEPITSFCNCVNKANVYLCAKADDDYTGSSDEDLKEFLKGKTINTGRFGGSPNLLVRYKLIELGLDPDKDVTLVEPADTSTSVAMVQTGQADVSWATEPQICDGMNKGVWGDAFYKFPDMGDYSYSVLSTRTSTIKNDPETVQKFTNAMLKALKAVNEDRDLAVSAAMKEFPTTDQTGIEAAIDRAYEDELWSTDGYISEEAVKNDMDVAIASNVYTGEYSYEGLVDMQFVEAASK